MKFFYESRTRTLELGERDVLAFPAHLHDQVEIVCILEGSAHAFADGKDYTLETGDFFIAFPNTVHFYDSCSDPIRILLVIASCELFPEYKREFDTQRPLSPHIKNPPSQAREVFEKAISTTGRFKEQISRGQISVLLGTLFEKAELVPMEKTEKNTVGKIIDYCRQNYQHNISLSDLSQSLNTSKSRISHIFSENLHISFKGLVNTFRLNTACDLLKNTEKSITAIALESGFENTRSFNRAFAKHLGTSPSKYKSLDKF